MVRGEEGRKDETCKEIAKVYWFSTQVQTFLPLNLDNYKHTKVSQTSFYLRSVQILRHFFIHVSHSYLPLLFSFRENSENEKCFTQGDVKESLLCFHHPLQVCHKHSERFVPRHHAMRDHSHSSYETTGRLWDQYFYPFFCFRIRTQTPTTPPHPVLFFF